MVLLFLMIILLLLHRPKEVFAEEEKRITLLATADVHGRLLPWDYSTDEEDLSGSLAQIATLVSEIRAEEKDVLLLDGGDILTGNSAGLFKDEGIHPAIRGLNFLDYDAWTVGNHEFDYGMSRLHRARRSFRGVTLAGNLFDFRAPGAFPGHEIFRKGDIKIGVIGMTTPMVTRFKKETNILRDVHLTDPVEEVKSEIALLRGRVHAMVGLLHMGLENENGIPHTGVRDVIAENPELDVVIAAHMHQLYEDVRIGNTLVAEPGKFGTHLLRIDLTFKKEEDWKLTKKESELLPVAGEEIVAPKRELLTMFLPYHLYSRNHAEEVIGTLKGEPLVPEDRIPGIPRVQTEETALTDWISQVMKHYSGAMVTAHQIDNDRAGMEPGPIRKKDIFRNYQYMGGEVTVYSMTGRDLKDYMEWAAGYFNRIRPGDITVSFRPSRRGLKYSTNDIFGGVTYIYDLRRPIGKRVKHLAFEDGRSIEDDTCLTLGVNAYRMEALLGPEGPLEGRQIRPLYSTGDPDRWGKKGKIQSLMMRDIKRRNRVLEMETGRRWKIVGPDPSLPGGREALELIREGILEIPSDFRGTNIRSINVYRPLTIKEQSELCRRGNIVLESEKDIPAGEFYKKFYEKYRKK